MCFDDLDFFCAFAETACFVVFDRLKEICITRNGVMEVGDSLRKCFCGIVRKKILICTECFCCMIQNSWLISRLMRCCIGDEIIKTERTVFFAKEEIFAFNSRDKGERFAHNIAAAFLYLLANMCANTLDVCNKTYRILENAGIDFLHNIFRLFFALYKYCIGAVDMTCGDGFKSVKLIPCCKFRKNKRKNLICHIDILQK